MMQEEEAPPMTTDTMTQPAKLNGPIDVVAFDFDGTLALLNIDFPAMRAGILDLIASYGMPLDGLRHLFALEMIDEARKWMLSRDEGRAAEFADRAEALIRAVEIDGADRGSLFPGVRELFARLRRENRKTAIVTRNCIESVRKLFPGAEDACECIVTREHTPLVKPHPEHLRIVLRMLGARPERAAMVGDHPMDMRLGKDAGTFSVGVLTGYGGEALLREAGADIVVPRVREVADILR